MQININKTAIFNWLEGRGARRTAVIVNLLIVIVIANSLAGFTWLLIAGSSKVVIPPPLRIQANPGDNAGANEFIKIAHLHLFGDTARKPKTERKPVRAPKKTTSRPLNLDLKGILYNDNQKLARAMIQNRGSEEEVFGVGSSINNQATVERIDKEAVILTLTDNSQQILKLPEETLNQEPLPTAQSSNSPASSRPEPELEPEPPQDPGGSESLASIREQILSNPDKINELVRIAPVSKGKQFLGFRVSPGKNRELFKQLGLRSGDVVTAVDDVTLDSPQRGFEVVQKFTTAQELNLTVKRGGSERSITIRF